MPELQWDELDFMECLEVEPEIDRYGFGWVYKVSKDGLKLIVDVQPLESYIWIEIRHQESNKLITEFSLFVREKVRYVNDKRGEYLEFSGCLMVPRVFTRRGSEVILDNIPSDWTVGLSIKPQIQIRYLD